MVQASVNEHPPRALWAFAEDKKRKLLILVVFGLKNDDMHAKNALA